MDTKIHTKTDFIIDTEIESGIPKEIPDSMDTNEALAFNQNNLAVERTEFAKIRTDLALTNTLLAINRTHLAYLRTIVTLIGSGATLYKALPLLGVAHTFSASISIFLFLAAAYFIYQDAATYPKMKHRLHSMETRASKLAKKMEDQVYRVDADLQQMQEMISEIGDLDEVDDIDDIN